MDDRFGGGLVRAPQVAARGVRAKGNQLGVFAGPPLIALEHG
jgi:hypothetical protein